MAYLLVIYQFWAKKVINPIWINIAQEHRGGHFFPSPSSASSLLAKIYIPSLALECSHHHLALIKTQLFTENTDFLFSSIPVPWWLWFPPPRHGFVGWDAFPFCSFLSLLHHSISSFLLRNGWYQNSSSQVMPPVPLTSLTSTISRRFLGTLVSPLWSNSSLGSWQFQSTGRLSLHSPGLSVPVYPSSHSVACHLSLLPRSYQTLSLPLVYAICDCNAWVSLSGELPPTPTPVHSHQHPISRAA